MSNITGKPVPFNSAILYVESSTPIDLQPNVYNTIIQLDSSNTTINLPSIDNMISGFSITVAASDNGVLELVPNGSDTILNGSELIVSSTTLPSCIIIASKNSNWDVILKASAPVSNNSVTMTCGGQTITPANTAVPVIWTDVVSNLSGMWSSLTPTRLRQPTGTTTGKYLVEYVVRWSSSPAGTRESFIRVNGGNDAFGWHRDNSMSNLTRNGFAIIQLNNANDYIELCANTSVIVPLNAGNSGTNPRSAQSANRITMIKM